MTNQQPESCALSTFAAVYIESGRILRLWFEAPDETAARAFCLRCNAGYQGPSAGPALPKAAPVAEAYNAKTARAMLGGVSAMTLYRWIALGELDRVQGTRRLLITRSSIERKCGKAR